MFQVSVLLLLSIVLVMLLRILAVVFRFCSRFVRTVTVIQGIIFLSLIEITLINNRSKTMHFLSNRVIAIVCIYFIRTRIRSTSREREREIEKPRAQSRTEY